MEWRAWVFKRVIHVTNTAHRAPYEILQQHNCRAHAMKRQHSSNFLSLHSLVVPIPLHCTLKCILIHFLQPHLLHFKKNKKTHTTTNPTYAHRKRKALHQFSYSTISYPSSLSFLFKSTDDSYITFCHSTLDGSHLIFFWQPLAFQFTSTYDDADQRRKIQEGEEADFFSSSLSFLSCYIKQQ